MPILVLKILFKFFYSLCAVSLTVETATTLINYTVQYSTQAQQYHRQRATKILGRQWQGSHW